MGMSKKEITIFAANIRIQALRAMGVIGGGHVGGAMSMADLMAVLYGGTMRIRVEEPDWEDRDWLVVSKGHSGPSLYAALALKGFFPMEELLTLNQGGTRLPSHCDRNLTPGVDMSTGSLGQGMSTAIGIAWGNRCKGKDSYTYLVIGDGESQEGQIWEGALFAAQQKLSNLVTFVDFNKKQLDGYTQDINDLGDFGQKFKDFGWYVVECNGHDIGQIQNAIELAKANGTKPSMIVLHTEKGKGCSFTEGILYNHHVMASPEDFSEAIHRLEQEIKSIESGEEKA